MARTITVNGLAVVAVEPRAATRPPILFIHGLLGGAWYFDRYQQFFAERGHPSFAVNLRGHHGSRPVPDLGRVSLREYAADALEAARWVGRPLVVGHSMGGLLALTLAAENAVPAAVLLAPAPPRGISVASLSLARGGRSAISARCCLRARSSRAPPTWTRSC